MKLSSEQEKALSLVNDWYKGEEQIFTLAGYAGTGKTTIAKLIANEVGADKVFFCAFTGKAALALRKSGVKTARTIHSLLYLPKSKSKERLRELQKALRDNPNSTALKRKITLEQDNIARPAFVLNEDSLLKNAELVVIDEYSMLDRKIIEDLRSVCTKILVLGDPGQLPPIAGASPLTPDYFLTEIHRQATDNPILRFATQVRNGDLNIPYGDYGAFKCVRKAEWVDYSSVDQVLVGRNKTRNHLNNLFRMRQNGLGEGRPPQTGEKIICLGNRHDLDIFNGYLGKITDCMDSGEEYYVMDVTWEDGAKSDALTVGKAVFENTRPEPWEARELVQMDFGYTITVHKSQGSEWDKVLVKAERMNDMDKWLYTALTRARNECVLVR